METRSQNKETAEIVTKRRKVSTAWCADPSKVNATDVLTSTINPCAPIYKDFTHSYKSNSKVVKQEFAILNYPFKCCQISSFLKNEQLITALDQEINDPALTMNSNSNDMFCFKQSNDLKHLTADQFPAITYFMDLLCKHVRPVMQDITGLELNDGLDFSLTVSKYNYGDYLLCHDDMLEGRRIAFIYYLSDPDWDVTKDGGALDLYNYDPETNNPINIVDRRPPTRNTLSFFEVSPITFHQVAEITRKNGCRRSIHGWFYGPEPKNKIATPKVLKPLSHPVAPCDIEEDVFVSWLSKSYLSNETINQVFRHFARSAKKSEHADMILSNFLEASNIKLLSDQLNSLVDGEKSRSFSHRGPPHERWCSVLPVSRDEIKGRATQLDKFLFFLMSDAFMVLLSQMTGLDYLDISGANSEPCKTAGCSHFEVRMWSAGDYSMLRDTDDSLKPDSVAVHFFVMSDPSSKGLRMIEDEKILSNLDSNPGSVVYVEKGKKDPVVVIDPQHNSMAIVVASPKPVSEKHGLVHFTRYMNKVIMEKQRYFEFYLVFNKDAVVDAK